MTYDPTIEMDEWEEELVVDEDDSSSESADEAEFDESSVVEGELVAYGDAEPVYIETPSGDVIDIANPELTYDEAKELTDHIRATADMMYVLISRAHAGKAWKALGYESFKDYVKEEFNISRSRAYQLLDQARVIEEITSVAPEGTEVRISEAEARDIKTALDELVPEIKERTENLDEDEDAGAIIEDLVKEFRERQNEEESFVGGDGESYPEEYEGDEADRQGFADYSGGNFGGGYDNDEDDIDDDEIDSLLDFDENPADVRRKFESVYALYTSLSSLREMPSVEEVIPWIPDERKIQISSSLPQALAWLQEFSAAWNDEGESNSPEEAQVSADSTEEDFTTDDDVDDLFEDLS